MADIKLVDLPAGAALDGTELLYSVQSSADVKVTTEQVSDYVLTYVAAAYQPLATVLTNTTASFTTAQETKLAGIEAGAEVNTVDSVAGKTGAVTLAKADVGLGNVDNTSDANKPVSTAQQTALNGKLSLGTSFALEGQELRLESIAAPAPPAANGIKIFGRQVATRNMPAFMAPSGFDSVLQPFLARNKIGYWCPPGNANTAPGVLGFTAPTITGFTATARNVATTNIFTRMRRLGYVTAATAGAVGHWRVAAYQYTVGSSSTNLGGFTYIKRFGISDAASVSGARMFIGMRSSSTPSNVEPSTLTNCIGVGHGASDTNLKIFYGGSSAQTPIDLGANFPITHGSVEAYELALYSAFNDSDVSYQVTRLSTGDTVTGTITNSGATVLPTHTTLIAPWGYRTNNATALAVGLDVMSAYIETDY
jgi:hypothetical protein